LNKLRNKKPGDNMDYSFENVMSSISKTTHSAKTVFADFVKFSAVVSFVFAVLFLFHMIFAGI